MKRKSSIVWLSIIGVCLIIGFVSCFVAMEFGLFDFEPFGKKISLGLDLKGGVYAVYEAENNSDEDFESAMSGTIASLQATLSQKGYTEALVQREGGAGIRVSVPNIDEPTELLKIIGSPAEIRFELDDGAGNRTTVLTGKEVVNARAQYSQENGEYVVALSFNSEGAKKFADATANNIGSVMHIIAEIGGEETTVSSPNIQSAITGGQAVITGMSQNSSDQGLKNAEELAGQIMSGKLSLKLTQKEVSTVSATLGENALKYGIIAGVIGIILVIIVMCWLYGLFGLSGGITLLIYTLMMIIFLAIFPWVQLTLPGIAGILLSIGMAIDGNVIIYERIKDEYRNGKSILSSAYYGYRKSRGAILDGNITTILAGVVLLIFGTGAVQGFAITLLIGLVLAVISSLIITYLLMNIMLNLNRSNPRLYRLVRGKDFESLNADQDSYMNAMQIEEEKKLKRERKEKEERERKESLANKGGMI